MTYHDTGHAFYHQALRLTSDVDAITIFGSGNDLINIASLGLATDEFVPEALTICGCINHTIDVIQGLLPDTPIGIIAPTPWAAYNPNIPGNDMALYVEKLAEIASLRGLPYLDLYYHSNLRPWDSANAALCFISDFLHFNVRGNEVIHGQIREFVRSLI
jgi:lysophospholipase L1-like esterase